MAPAMRTKADPLLLCKAIKAVRIGTPGVNNGDPWPCRRAWEIIGGGLGGGFALSTPSKWAKVRPENAVFQERVFEIDFENWTQAELEIECGTLCRMACQEGHPTLFTPSEEAGLVKHCLSVLPRWPPWRPS